MSDTAAGAEPVPITLGVVRETLEGEARVAITPAVLSGLVRAGLNVMVESGAGQRAGFSDQAYAEKGATITSRVDALGADILAAVRVLAGNPASPDLDHLRGGQIVIGMAAPLAAPEVAAAIAAKGVRLFALELVPRTSRAQAMDVLSSQAVVAGYKAVLLAAEASPKLFPLMTTAAGTIPPARVFVMGAGVAGLSAIATARRLGAVVEAYDVRGAVKEEVQSLGARFVEVPLETGQEGGSGAYAAELSEDMLRKQRELMAKTVAGSDVVITTAQVQGRQAPILLTTELVEGMAPGSVVIDLAAEQGGNCQLTKAGRAIDHGGVIIIGPVNIAASAPHDASLMYAKNVANMLGLLVKDKAITVDLDDDIIRESLVSDHGAVIHPRVLQAMGAPLPTPPTPDTKETAS
jgi:H+-translocating NAD(P) transhydrogenase subunit alpha